MSKRKAHVSHWDKNGLVDWVEYGTAYISVVFSWQLQEAHQLAAWYRAQDYHVVVGGPAVALAPDYLRTVAEVGTTADALKHHNPHATFTSRGCVRKCEFCAVPKIEGDMVELEDWPIRPVVCDNNITACSRAHFDDVIDKLKPLSHVDFQGLDARLLTKHHVDRLAELRLSVVRLAWDNTKTERHFMRARQLLKDAHVPDRQIRVYVLIGFDDTPEDALYRLETIKSMGLRPFPMRYQPIDTHVKNSYISPAWTDRELKRYMRYWARLRYFEHLDFANFRG